MKTEKIGLYVHTPLCVQKCNYCDFCSYSVASADWRSTYMEKICAEIESYKDRDILLDTVFFGGGTPSLLSAVEFSEICESIRKTFKIDSNVEFTLEANPKTLTAENLEVYISSGVNRLSIGLQSIHENEMKILGRIHNFDDFIESYNLARGLGINNINIDLMYGIPDQTVESFEQTLERVLSIYPEHISLYGLILEEGTPFYSMRKDLKLPTEDTECDMYLLAADKLRASGYSHYEISNYARAGYESRHNLKYWRCQEYIGVGVSAYSYLDSQRFGNSSKIYEYLAADSKEYSYREKIDRETLMYEYVMLGLRLRDGISLEEYLRSFGEDFINNQRDKKIKEYISLGYMIIKDGRLYLTERGFYISNSILCDLL